MKTDEALLAWSRLAVGLAIGTGCWGCGEVCKRVASEAPVVQGEFSGGIGGNDALSVPPNALGSDSATKGAGVVIQWLTPPATVRGLLASLQLSGYHASMVGEFTAESLQTTLCACENNSVCSPSEAICAPVTGLVTSRAYSRECEGGACAETLDLSLAVQAHSEQIEFVGTFDLKRVQALEDVVCGPDNADGTPGPFLPVF